jgi:hypothetical protein
LLVGLELCRGHDPNTSYRKRLGEVTILFLSVRDKYRHAEIVTPAS